MSRLRVGVAPELLELSPHSGHGRVWQALLRELRLQARVQVGSRVRRPDVWLVDGHSGRPVPEDRPAIAVVHEASWHLPEVAATLDEAFRVHLEDATTRSTEGAYGICSGSAWGRQTIIDALGTAPDRVWVTPYGVDCTIFRPGLARPAGLPDRYVLFTGTVHPRKNIEALRAGFAAAVRAGLPHTLVLVIGPAADRKDSGGLIAAATARLPGIDDRVLRVDAGDDGRLAAIMAGADAVCMPSIAEGFGLPALEAMACGTPVVASDRGALPEVVTGRGGVIVAPTPEGVCRGLLEILGDPTDLATRRIAARTCAEGRPWSRTADAVMAALEQATSA